MNWIEVTVSVADEHVEPLCAALAGIAPGGFSIEEPIVPLGPEEGVRHEPWRPTHVRFYLPEDAHLAVRRAALQRAVARLDFPVEAAERLVREEDWAESWKEFFHVERVGRRLVIRPAWRDYTPAPGEVVIDLDPGMAFGTGQHETTRMCLQLLETLPVPGADVLDLGCGSGILAVAAALLGARQVFALDVEDVAVQATAANARRNGVQERVQAAAGSLGSAWPFTRPPEAAFDLILANIHAGALVDLAVDLRRALRPAGALVGSGVIAERLPAVVEALRNTGFAEPEVRAEGEWRTLIARASERSAG